MHDILCACKPCSEHMRADDAFDFAIDAGRLSADPASPLYAGKYMYMGQRGGVALFKSIQSREYLS